MQKIAREMIRLRHVALALCGILAGCGIVSNQSVYEGVRSVQKGRSAEPAPGRQDLPPYEDYEKERSRIRNPSSPDGDAPPAP